MSDSPAIPLEQQSKEDLSHLLVGRVRAELGHGQCVCRLGQPVSLVVIRQFKSDFHSMHRHGVNLNTMRQAPHKLSVHAGYVIVGRIIKRLVGKLHGLLKHGFVVHGSIVGQGGAGFHSYFPLALNAKNFASCGTGNYRKFP